MAYCKEQADHDSSESQALVACLHGHAQLVGAHGGVVHPVEILIQRFFHETLDNACNTKPLDIHNSDSKVNGIILHQESQLASRLPNNSIS